MLGTFTHLDAISGFVKLYDAWLSENSETWHSKELKKSLDSIVKYIDQLASYISVAHNEIEIQVNVDSAALTGKQFATIIKRTEEWKALKKWLKTEMALNNQPVSVEAIVRCIIAETKKFVKKV